MVLRNQSLLRMLCFHDPTTLMAHVTGHMSNRPHTVEYGKRISSLANMIANEFKYGEITEQGACRKLASLKDKVERQTRNSCKSCRANIIQMLESHHDALHLAASLQRGDYFVVPETIPEDLEDLEETFPDRL